MNFINRILSHFQIRLHRTTSLDKEISYYTNTIKRISDFYGDVVVKENEVLNTGITGIVFSKNRAMQLHMLLSSYFYFTKNPASLVILYTHNDEQHKKAYEILKKEFESPQVLFVSETNFTSQLNEIICSLTSDRLFFMTDDGVFLDHYDLLDCLHFHPIKDVFSLRLGADLSFCYTQNKLQEIPVFSIIHKDGLDFNTWLWQDMIKSPDWIYPLSVDATIFYKKEIEVMHQKIVFKSPNSLESEMQGYNPLFTNRRGVCYSKVKYVNIPCNIVQNEFSNIHTGTYSVSELLDRFLNGERIDWHKFEGQDARNVQLARFSFIKKTCNKYNFD